MRDALPCGKPSVSARSADRRNSAAPCTARRRHRPGDAHGRITRGAFDPSGDSISQGHALDHAGDLEQHATNQWVFAEQTREERAARRRQPRSCHELPLQARPPRRCSRRRRSPATADTHLPVQADRSRHGVVLTPDPSPRFSPRVGTKSQGARDRQIAGLALDLSVARPRFSPAAGRGDRFASASG
jgi:hypothetical protein